VRVTGVYVYWTLVVLPLGCASKAIAPQLFSAKGAHSAPAWGSAPGLLEPQNRISAEGAIHFLLRLRNHLQNDSRCQRLVRWAIGFLGRCPRLP
jgi:hypothetical protein